MRVPIASFLATAFVLGGMTVEAAAQGAFPVRPIRMVVPNVAGGVNDVVGRIFAESMTATLGRQVVVDNRPGAGGVLGADMVAKSPADGYTLVVSNIAAHGSGPAITAAMPYDADRDFTHIALIGTVANALVVHPSFPAKSLQEFIAYAKAKPGVFFGSGGRGTSAHLAGELLRVAAGIELQHVPYRGAAPAMTDLLANQIPAVFDGVPAIAPTVRAGQLRMLAVTSPERAPAMPDVPTFAEAGLPGYEATSWFGISGPAGLPAPVTARLSTDLRAIMKSPEVSARLAELSFGPRDLSPEEYRQFVRTELAKWADVVRSAGIKPE